ncbi:MAG: DUF3795 domain-containing protein [Anaerolineae bacterium]|nr:DUF3795 domain-containing protein [Anaerolineae bacterium]
MADKIIAFCGIICSECDAYKATQSGDQSELEGVAAAWREQYSPDITAAAIICEGCLATEGPQCSHCSECPIRACAIDRGVQSCAHCADYGCDTIEQFLSHAPMLREALDNIRAAYLAARND